MHTRPQTFSSTGCSQWFPTRPQQAKSRGVLLWYAEALRDARTKLGAIFNIL